MKYLDKVTDKEIESILSSCGLELAKIIDESRDDGSYIPSIDRSPEGVFIRALDNKKLASYSAIVAEISYKFNISFPPLTSSYSNIVYKLINMDDYSIGTVLDLEDNSEQNYQLQSTYTKFMINKFGQIYKDDLQKEIDRLQNEEVTPSIIDDDNCM